MKTKRRKLAHSTYSKITGKAIHRSQEKENRRFNLLRPNAVAFKYQAMTYLIKERLERDIPGAFTKNVPIGAEPQNSEEIYSQALPDVPEEPYVEEREVIPPITPADDPNSSFYDEEMPEQRKGARKNRKKKRISVFEEENEEDLDEIIAQKVNDDGYYGELLPSDIDEIFVKPRKKVELWKFAVIAALLILGIVIIIVNIKNLIG